MRGGVGVVAEARPELDGVAGAEPERGDGALGAPGIGVEGELAAREIARVGLEVDVDAGAGEGRARLLVIWTAQAAVSPARSSAGPERARWGKPSQAAREESAA